MDYEIRSLELLLWHQICARNHIFPLKEENRYKKTEHFMASGIDQKSEVEECDINCSIQLSKLNPMFH